MINLCQNFAQLNLWNTKFFSAWQCLICKSHLIDSNVLSMFHVFVSLSCLEAKICFQWSDHDDVGILSEPFSANSISRGNEYEWFQVLFSWRFSLLLGSGGAGPSSGGTSVRNWESELAKMREMGISDETLAKKALTLMGGDIQAAIELIFSGWDGMDDSTNWSTQS